MHAINSRLRLRACDECSRRKVRCDRERPCQPCLSRGIGRFCLQSQPLAAAASHVGSSRLAVDGLSLDSNTPVSPTVAILYEHIADLEEQLAQYRRDSEASCSLPLDISGAKDTSYDMLEISFEQLNLGLGDGELDTPATVSDVAGTTPQSTTQVYLPSRETSLTIVQFAMTYLGWIHCALRADIFVAEHCRFWDALEADPGLLALDTPFAAIYFAVLSVGAYYIDPQYTQSHARLNPMIYREDALLSASKHWYRASLRVLERADFLGKPRLETLQVFAILTLVSPVFGEKAREAILLSAALRIARMLHMHQLGNEDLLHPEIKNIPLWSTYEQRSLGRRLWWTLVICDWLGMMNHDSTVLPQSFDTVFDPSGSVEDVCLPLQSPSSSDSCETSHLHYHALLSQLAGIIRSKLRRGEAFAQERLASAMREVEAVYSKCQSHLRSIETDLETGQPLWMSMQQYLANHTVQFLRLTIARPLITSWMRRQPDPDGFHAKAREAAEIIAQEKHRNVPPLFNKSWIVQASTVAAGVFMCLDLLFFSTGDDVDDLRHRRNCVERCIVALQSIGRGSVISKRGPMILRSLLDFESRLDHRSVPDEQPLREIIFHVSQLVSSASALEAKFDGSSWDPSSMPIGNQQLFRDVNQTDIALGQDMDLQVDRPFNGSHGLITAPSADPISASYHSKQNTGFPAKAVLDVEGGFWGDPFGYIVARTVGEDDTSGSNGVSELESFDNPFEFTEKMYFKDVR